MATNERDARHGGRALPRTVNFDPDATLKDKRPLLRRVFLTGLAAALLVLQVRLWVSDDGFSGVVATRDRVEAQRLENAELRQRNRRLAAEVKDLKRGYTALEERARADLGLIAPNEMLYVIGSTNPAQVESGR